MKSRTKLEIARALLEKILVRGSVLWFSLIIFLFMIGPRLPGYEWGSPVYHVQDVMIRFLITFMLSFVPLWGVLYVLVSVFGYLFRRKYIHGSYFATATVFCLGSFMTLAGAFYVLIKECPSKNMAGYGEPWWCNVAEKQLIFAMFCVYVMGLMIGPVVSLLGRLYRSSSHNSNT